MKRSEASQKATALGARVTESMSKNTDILVAGPGAGQKISKAQGLGVEVWTEEQFMAAVNDPLSDEDFGETNTDLSSMKVGELRALCVERGLPKTGSKAVLIERLQAAEGGDEEEEETDWASMKPGKLRAACVERGLPKTGSKAVLIERLQAAAGGEEEEKEEGNIIFDAAVSFHTPH